MGRFQQLRAKAISLRGAIAVGGALVMAASMAQASGTLAESAELREAKAGIATQNYFPTPLTTSVTCTTDPDRWWDLTANRARIDWAPVPGATGYLVVFINKSNGSVYRTEDVEASVTRISGVTATNPRTSLYVRVHTKNGPAISSGFAVANSGMSFKDWVSDRTECEGSGGSAQANAPWENQYDWDPGVIPFATGPSPSIFGALFDEGADLLGDLPEGNELTSLDDAALDTSPDRSEQATAPPNSTPTSPTPSNPASSRSTSAPTSPGATSVGKGTTESAPSMPATTSSPTVPTSSADASPTSVKSTPSSSTPAAPSTTAQQSVRAGVGDGPIAVGSSQARLDEVDGRTRLSVTRGGSEVCTAEVDGASRIESSGGVLAVTVSGRTSPVDLETCELT